MSCWDILERRAKVDRDQAAEAVSRVKAAIEEQQILCDRTQEIANQYQKKSNRPRVLPHILVIYNCIEHRLSKCSRRSLIFKLRSQH